LGGNAKVNDFDNPSVWIEDNIAWVNVFVDDVGSMNLPKISVIAIARLKNSG
jgi:hypothetical protein